MKQKSDYFKAIFSIVLILIILIAWITGRGISESRLYPLLVKISPQEGIFISQKDQIYTAWEDSTKQKIVSYFSLGECEGYGGRLKTAVCTDTIGIITRITIINHKETPVFLRRIISNGMFKQFIGKAITDSLKMGIDIDCISGATYTSRAIINSVNISSKKIIAFLNHTPYKEIKRIKFTFGTLEFLLILFLIVGIILRSLKPKHLNTLRLISLFSGLIIFGFIFKFFITLSFINRLLIGSFPNINTHLNHYILITSIILIILISKKNPYYAWFCPFGAVQEFIGKIGGAKNRVPINKKNIVLWMQRSLVLLAIIIALLFRNPTISSYEIFATFFNLTGSNIQFILLAIILILSLFQVRPWCSFFCPIKPFIDFIQYIRKQAKLLWKKIST